MNMKFVPMLALATAIVGCNPSSTTTSAEKAPTPAAPTTEVVKRQDLIGYSFFDGKLVVPASAQTSVFSPYDAPVISVSTGLGKYVRRGDAIIKLNLPGAETETTMAKANANSANTSYDDQKTLASAPVKQAMQALSDAKRAEKAAAESGGDVAAATQARVDAESTLREARQQMNETLQPAKDAVSSSASGLQAAKADTAKGIVRAPISGTIVALDAKEGMSATAKQNLATIINFEAARVQGALPPALRDEVVKGSKVIVAMNGPSSDPMDGKVLDVTVLPPVAGQKSNGYLAVIAFSNPRTMTQPGLGVTRIGVKTGSVKNALVVPTGSIVKKDGKSYVSVQNGNEWLDTAVETGISDGALIEIKSGLKEGAVVRVLTPAANIPKP